MDASYTVEVVIEENSIHPLPVMQVGMLYSSCYGAFLFYSYAPRFERVSSRRTKDQGHHTRFAHVVTKTVTDILDAHRTTIAGPGSGSGGLVASESLRDLSVLALGLINSVAVRQSASIPSDMRAYAMALLKSLTPQLLVPYLCPNFYSLHDMQEEVSASSSFPNARQEERYKC